MIFLLPKFFQRPSTVPNYKSFLELPEPRWSCNIDVDGPASRFEQSLNTCGYRQSAAHPKFSSSGQNATLNLVSGVSEVSHEKEGANYLISGSSCNVFHDRELFFYYRKLLNSIVKDAFNISRVNGEGTEDIYVGKDVLLHAYHAFKICTNTIAAHPILIHRKTLFTLLVKSSRMCLVVDRGTSEFKNFFLGNLYRNRFHSIPLIEKLDRVVVCGLKIHGLLVLSWKD